MPVLDVDGDRLHYVEEGAGVPVVLVHGSCGGAGQWKALVTGLSEEYRTVCLDLFGKGQSEPWPMERQWTVDDDGRALAAILDQLNEPFHLIVHSARGPVSYPTVKKRRDLIRTLTLFEPAFFQLLRQNADPLFAERRSMSKCYRAAMEAGDRESAMASFVDVWAKSQGTWEGLPDRVKKMMWIGAGRLYHDWLNPWLEEPSTADLANLNIPVLLIKGSETIDSMHRVCELMECSRPDCRHVEIEGAGHMSPFTHANVALALVRQHLQRG
jgi:pimeloyl-ACP methyl ester carboxylesterase